MSVFLARRWQNLPHGEVEPNWDHPAFGETAASVFIGGYPTFHHLRAQRITYPYATNGTIAIGRIYISENNMSDDPLLWQAWSSELSNSRIELGEPFKNLYTLLLSRGSRINTNDGLTANYYGYRVAISGQCGFGTGATGSGGRRDWTWTNCNRATVIRPNSNMATQPTVYTDGTSATVSANGGTGSTYNWGNSTTMWQIGYDAGSSTYSTLHRMAFGVAFNTSMPTDMMAQLSDHPLQLVRRKTARLYSFPSASAPAGLSIPIAAYHYNHHLGSMQS